MTELVIKKRRGMRKKTKIILQEGKTIFLNGLLFKNPVVIGALGLYPVAAAGYNLKNAAALSFMMLIMMLPVCLISGWVGNRIPFWIRPAMVLALSALCYLPAILLLNRVMPAMTVPLGIFAPLMIGNSILLSRANDYAPSHITAAVLADSLGCTAGFTFIICLVGAIREILSQGTLWGLKTSVPAFLQKPATYPFFGFLLLGFCSALLQWMNSRRERSQKQGGDQS